VIGSPICTDEPALSSDVSDSSIDENVAPWMPSRPVRPPTVTIASPGSTHAAGHGGDAHAVAVVAHAGDDAAQDAARVQRALRHRGAVHVGRGDEEGVGAGDRLGAEAGPEDVADHAADAGAGAAVGVDGTGVVVRLDLDADVPVAVELDDAGVVDEDADAEVTVELVRRGGDGGLQQVVDALDLAVLALEVDHPRERLVLAVLGPGLRDGLELARGRLAAQLLEVGLDGAHLGQREAELPVARQPLELGVVGGQQRDLDAPALAGAERGAVGRVLGVDPIEVDRLVGEHARGQQRQLVGRRVARQLVDREGGHVRRALRRRVAGADQQVLDGARQRVHDGRAAHDQHAVGGPGAVDGRGRLAGGGDPGVLQHRVDQQAGRQRLDGRALIRGGEQVPAAHANVAKVLEVQLGGRRRDVRALGVVEVGAAENLHAPGVREGHGGSMLGVESGRRGGHARE
jgi:hypothetical protein